MKVRVTLVGLVAALTTLVGLTAVAAANDGERARIVCKLETVLDPANEVLRTTPNTSVAGGLAQITVLSDGTILFKVFIYNKAHETFFAGHIHGPATTAQNAGIVVDLLGGPAGGSAFSTLRTRLEGEGVPRATAPGIATLLCEAPSRYYVNFHTTAEPSGAIRGQLG